MRLALVAAFFAGSLMVASLAQADVRVGRGVRVGGHALAPQTFSQKRRGLFYLHRAQPPHAGCRWARSPGGRTKICHWRPLRR
jgi:hypothetical protein